MYISELQDENMYLQTCRPGEDSDQPTLLSASLESCFLPGALLVRSKFANS